MEHNELHIREIFENFHQDGCSVLYADEEFVRQSKNITQDQDISVSILCDTLRNNAIDNVYISLSAERSFGFELQLEGLEIIEADWGILFRDVAQSILYWFPTKPKARIFDTNKRILKTVDVEYALNNGSVVFDCPAEIQTQICILKFTEGADEIYSELVNRDDFENTEFFRFHKNIFHYAGLNDLWKYLIGGHIYKPGTEITPLSVQSQHTAYSLYYHISYLYDRFGKTIYSAMRDMVAYSVLLSQEDDGRWRHGLWSDKIETHCIFQASGMDVLIDYYERTQTDIFIEKAKASADWLIKHSDKLDNGMIWFLHDSLELNIEDAKLYYEPLIPSSVFGKSESNTLCLNSHLWIMIVLYRLLRHDGCQKYQDVMQKAIESLKLILCQKPAELRYILIYFFRDLFYSFAYKVPCKLSLWLKRKYESFLVKGWLQKFKTKYPRILMPNGFTERDITHSVIMNDYHLVNLRFMLILCRLMPEKWYGDVIEKCIRYTIKGSMVHSFSRINPKAALVVDILVLYTSLISDKYLPAFSKYVPHITGYDTGIAIDTVSNPEIAGRWNGLSIDNKNVIMLPIEESVNCGLAAVLVNISASDQEVELDYDKGVCNDYFSAVDLAGNSLSIKEPLKILSGRVILVKPKITQKE